MFSVPKYSKDESALQRHARVHSGGAPLVSIVQIILLIQTPADSYGIILKKEKEVGR